MAHYSRDKTKTLYLKQYEIKKLLTQDCLYIARPMRPPNCELPAYNHWMREAFWEFGRWVDKESAGLKKKYKFVSATDAEHPIKYAASEHRRLETCGEGLNSYHKRPSAVMPKDKSRITITMEVLGHGASSLESVHTTTAQRLGFCTSSEFRTHYLRENPAEAKKKNPWVWVLRLKIEEVKK